MHQVIWPSIKVFPSFQPTSLPRLASIRINNAHGILHYIPENDITNIFNDNKQTICWHSQVRWGGGVLSVWGLHPLPFSNSTKAEIYPPGSMNPILDFQTLPHGSVPYLATSFIELVLHLQHIQKITITHNFCLSSYIYG